MLQHCCDLLLAGVVSMRLMIIALSLLALLAIDVLPMFMDVQ